MDPTLLTRANERAVLAAERAGLLTVDGLPLRLNLELTAACNIHCPMCQCELNRERHRPTGSSSLHMPVETFRAIAAAAFPRVSIVNPTMVGEPLMLPYLDELFERAAANQVRIDIMTNGTLLTPELSARILPTLAGMAFSFDGATRATFAKIRRGASYDTVLGNLAAFARQRRELGLRQSVPLAFSVALMRENIRELPALIELAARHDVDIVVASHMAVVRPELEVSSLAHEPALTEEYLGRARDLARSLGVEARFPTRIPSGARSRPGLTQDSRGPSDPPRPTRELRAPLEPWAPSAGPAALPGGRPLPKGGPLGLPLEPCTAITSGKPELWEGKVYCRFPWRETFISIGGDVAPCCAQGRPVFGNAFLGDFLSIWNGPFYQALRRCLYRGDLTAYCKTCSFLEESGQSRTQAPQGTAERSAQDLSESDPTITRP